MDLRARILVAEDEPDIRRFVRMALESEGHEVFEAGTLQRSLIEAGSRRPDLAIVDLGLPDGDGIDLIRDLRGWSAAPVIVLSARSGEAQKVTALDAGADDYLVKPFGAAELLARVRAQLRRRALTPSSLQPVLQFGRTSVDLARRVVERDGRPLHLTPIEYRLLTHLAAQPDRVVTHQQLLKAVWGPGHADDTHYVRVHMANLRKKVEDDPSRPRHLLTEAGVGYRFRAREDDRDPAPAPHAR
jgi:two-component system, OmpR family, KDP operon response regulator KdpE